MIKVTAHNTKYNTGGLKPVAYFDILSEIYKHIYGGPTYFTGLPVNLGTPFPPPNLGLILQFKLLKLAELLHCLELPDTALPGHFFTHVTDFPF